MAGDTTKNAKAHAITTAPRAPRNLQKQRDGGDDEHLNTCGFEFGDTNLPFTCTHPFSCARVNAVRCCAFVGYTENIAVSNAVFVCKAGDSPYSKETECINNNNVATDPYSGVEYFSGTTVCGANSFSECFQYSFPYYAPSSIYPKGFMSSPTCLSSDHASTSIIPIIYSSNGQALSNIPVALLKQVPLTAPNNNLGKFTPSLITDAGAPSGIQIVTWAQETQELGPFPSEWYLPQYTDVLCQEENGGCKPTPTWNVPYQCTNCVTNVPNVDGSSHRSSNVATSAIAAGVTVGVVVLLGILVGPCGWRWAKFKRFVEIGSADNNVGGNGQELGRLPSSHLGPSAVIPSHQDPSAGGRNSGNQSPPEAPPRVTTPPPPYINSPPYTKS